MKPKKFEYIPIIGFVPWFIRTMRAAQIDPGWPVPAGLAFLYYHILCMYLVPLIIWIYN